MLKKGGLYSNADDRHPYVRIAGNQNPASSEPAARATLDLFKTNVLKAARQRTSAAAT
jgi:hypothetical protein